MAGFILEVLEDPKAEVTARTQDGMALELSVGESTKVGTIPGLATVEVYGVPVLPNQQVGGADPTANPNVLVWFDTQGA